MRENGSAINAPGKVGYYTIPQCNVGVSHPGFSFFRLIPTRPNSSNTYEIALTGFEIYGELFESLSDAIGADSNEAFKWPTRDEEVGWWSDEAYYIHLGEASVPKI